MSNTPGSQKPNFLDFLFQLLGLSRPGTSVQPPAAQPAIPPDSTTEPARIVTTHVLLVTYDPIMDPAAGTKITQKMNWRRPEDLANDFIQDILETSAGLARFEIVQRIELNEFPALSDGFRYTPQTILPVLNNPQLHHEPKYIDYQAVLTGLNVFPRIESHEIDEVWLFGYPWAGFYESTMCGAGAFHCNSDPQSWSGSCQRRFVVMGFNYERGVGEMVHSFGHRTESILTQAFVKTKGAANLYNKFALYDKIAPGESGLGTIHNPPNSDRDYDYANPRKVLSSCYDWYNFPNFKDDVRLVNSEEWGGGDMRLLHKWWLKHLPKIAGRINGVANNWWQYTMDPNLVNL